MPADFVFKNQKCKVKFCCSLLLPILGTVYTKDKLVFVPYIWQVYLIEIISFEFLAILIQVNSFVLYVK